MRKASVPLGGGYKPSPEVGLLPASAYLGRWYRGSSPPSSGRRYNISRASAAYASYVAGLVDSEGDFGNDLVGGHGIRSVGRTIPTRVTPAPGYGPRSSYARAHSLSRFM